VDRKRKNFSVASETTYRCRFASWLFLGWTCILAVLLPAPPALATHEPATEKQAAFQLVLERCYLCHYLDRADFKFAPSLKGIYAREGRALSNGKPINDQTLTEIISEGTPNMPGFKYALNPQQMQLILKFLKEGWASEVPMLRNAR